MTPSEFVRALGAEAYVENAQVKKVSIGPDAPSFFSVQVAGASWGQEVVFPLDGRTLLLLCKICGVKELNDCVGRFVQVYRRLSKRSAIEGIAHILNEGDVLEKYSQDSV